MSEKAPKHNELVEIENVAEHLAEKKLLPTPEQAEPLRKGEADPVKLLERQESARNVIEQTASHENPLDKLEQDETPSIGAPASVIDRSTRKATARRELRQIRSKLNPRERVLSQVVHQPVVRAISEAAGATVSRPSGLLGGGLVAFLGSSAYLYFTKHIGLTYNYLVFLLLFVGGFLIGLVLELAVHLATASRRHGD